MDQKPWLRLTLALLATWRLTHLLALEDGPGDVIANMRQWLGSSFLGKLMDCFYCLSLWIAAPLAFLLTNQWREWPWLWLALSGAACLLERWGNPSLTIQQIPQGEE
jgi:Protein of unknown function (DUF1360)